jgi:hypothetical protein
MYRKEKLFMDKFIAAIVKNDYHEISLDEQTLKMCLPILEQSMNDKKMFNSNPELALLFVKEPIEGDYDSFRHDLIRSVSPFMGEIDEHDHSILRILLNYEEAESILIKKGELGITEYDMIDITKKIAPILCQIKETSYQKVKL